MDIHSWWEVPCIAHFCSLFRASFNLIDFDIEDLEEALLTDDASDSGNTLIQELIVRLLRGYYGNNSISTFNYQMFLRRLFRQKCREFNCYNPFDNDEDFQFLPMRTKVEILHMLCDFRLDADDVLDILKDLDSDSLRVHPLGYDANKSAYWYFYGTRLYREDYPKIKKEKEKKRGRKRKRGRNKEEESEEEEVELGSGIWQVICFTESDWERLAVNTEDATDKNEQALHQIIAEDFLPEIPKLFQEKERLQRKRFLELHPRKSSRIENLKRRKEEEMQYLEKYKRALSIQGTDSEEEVAAETNAKKAKKARHDRWKNRNTQKELYSDDDNSDTESLQESVTSYGSKPIIAGRGRQTNNSLSSATGEIIIHSAEKNRSPEWCDIRVEYLDIGLHKVLETLKKHEDAWPFKNPVDEKDAPNYYKVVKTPMSLRRMEEKLDCGKYKSVAEFKRDFQLIMANCKQYNGSRNEYTAMGENLEKVLQAGINKFFNSNNSSDGDDVTENSDFPDVNNGSHRRKKRKRRKRTTSKSTEDNDKENERKLSALDAPYSINSIESESRNADDALSIESRIGEHKPIKRGKGRPPKNASSFDAFDIVAEQTLRDINKWLNDTPKSTDFGSASNSPPPSNSPSDPIAIDVSLPTTGTHEKINPQKSNIRPFKHKELTKKRSLKENHHKHLQMIKQRRRDTQRTIDRLQPGKSKGNLISTISKPPGGTKPDDLPGSAKINKEPAAKTSENTHRMKPMLSLGSVLSTDVINLDVNSKKHTFSDNDSVPSDDEDPFSDGEATASNEHNEPQAENLALDKAYSESAYLEEKKAQEEKQQSAETKQEVASGSSNGSGGGSGGNVGGEMKAPASVGGGSSGVTSAAAEKNDKPKPNLGAWFKAFGAPKAQQTPKRKQESTFNDNPATPLANEELKDDYGSTSGKMASKSNEEDRYDINEPPPPTPGRFFLYEEDRERNVPAPLLSPDLKPMRRQRKLSTGSSISERSSFSQDPNDPMNSPHPSLDESSYQSPQPYHHQSPIHNTGALKVGFYQDTFPKCGSDKSNSCSPREPMNSCSPQHPMFSPRDSLASPRDSIASPRDPICSPKMAEPVHSPGVIQMTSPHNPMPSPRYTPVASPRDPYAGEPVHSPVYVPKSDPQPASSPYKPFRNAATPQPPQPAPNPPQEKSPFSIYPVKKRISAELEQTSKQQAEQHEKMAQSESPFVPVSSHDGDRHFTPTPGCLPQHILPPHNPYPPPPDPGSIPMSIPHHHPFMDTYSDNILLSSNPYFRKDLYVPGQPPPIVSSASSGQPSHLSSLFMQQSEGMYQSPVPGDKMGQNPASGRYSPPRQASPMVGGPAGYGRAIDFTAPAKPNESFAAQYHHSKFHVVNEADVALNYSNKTQHGYPPGMNYPAPPPSESDRAKMEAEYHHQRAAKMESPLQPYHHHAAEMHERAGPPPPATPVAVSSEQMYHGSAPHTGYHRSGPSPYANPPSSSDYFNGKPPPPHPASNYHLADLRAAYPSFANPNERQMHDDKQYYQTAAAAKTHHMDQAYMADRSMTELINSRQPHFNPLPNISSAAAKLTSSGSMATSAANNRYDLSYHNRPEPMPPVSAAPPAPPTKPPAKKSSSSSSKKKKAAAAAAAAAAAEQQQAANESSQAQNPSMYYHHLGGGQPNVGVGVSQDLKHNGIVPGSAFNFGTATAATTLKSDYQQYFDNLRSSRFFAETAAAAANEKPSPGPAPAAVSNASFPFLPPQRGSPSFSLAHAQAFMNANAPPCPPAIYSSPFLQRPPDELLRPMMLQQGLMSAHNGGYPHGYLNMHDPINRSPWL
ncbi:chromatin remodeling regulator CECR2-like isoform X2 [Planococcus citri]|uniref:chromatin remodeling regulator CECR2-like isoform X2 n=1 Tax=Planococcus citri TaxID=170843 RepID=UPI0031F93719